MNQFRSIEENWKFDLTTLGFNDQKCPVPSGLLIRVPTVFLIEIATGIFSSKNGTEIFSIEIVTKIFSI